MESQSWGSGGQPSPEQLARMQARVQQMRARQRIVPVAWPLSMLLARSDEAAVALTGALLYRDSTELALRLVLRRERQSPFPVPMRLSGLGGPIQAPEELLRFGVLLADGRSTTNTEAMDPLRSLMAADDGLLALTPGRGGGDSQHYEWNLMLSAVPPDGPMTLFVQWPAFGIDETRVVVDATGMAAAAEQAIQLWSNEAEPETPQRSPQLRFGDRAEGAFFKPILGVQDADQ